MSVKKTVKRIKKPGRGGYRPGAGRPATGRTKEGTFTARHEDIQILHKVKAITGESLRDIFRRIAQQELERVEDEKFEG